MGHSETGPSNIGKHSNMRINVLLAGTDPAFKNKKGESMPLAWGLETGVNGAPATLRQVVKFSAKNLPEPGKVATVEVREITEIKGVLWLRGDVVGAK